MSIVKPPATVFPSPPVSPHGPRTAPSPGALGLGPPPVLLSDDETLRQHEAAVRAALAEAFADAVIHLGDAAALRLWDEIPPRRKRGGRGEGKAAPEREDILARHADRDGHRQAIAWEAYRELEHKGLVTPTTSDKEEAKRVDTVRKAIDRFRNRRRVETRMMDAALPWTMRSLLSDYEEEPDKK